MKKSAQRILGVVLLLVLATTCYGDQSDAEDAKYLELQKQIEGLQQEMTQMREEAEARKKLEITEEEKAETGKDVLSAAGRQYTLLQKDTLEVEYRFDYTYFSYDVVANASSIEHHSNHNLTNTITIDYPFFDNLTLNAAIPFIYKYDQTGTDNSKEVSDFGNISFGAQWQPMKSGGDFPTTILYGTLTTPTGRSPYEINPDQDIPTGTGYYSATGGVSLSGTIDPLVAFGGLSYTHNFEADNLHQRRSGGRVLVKVDPGDSIGLNLGIGYALSYKANLNLSYQYSYGFESQYEFEDGTTKTGTTTSSIFTIGTGWHPSPKRSFNISLGIGLTNDDPDFTFTVRIPFDFQLGSSSS